jgi:hypothetical protein
MIGYIIVSVGSDILFDVLDGVINANPVAQRLYEVYKPIARTSINPLTGIVIDLVYGFAMVGMFLLLYKSLPGENEFVKGISFACLAWFFRVLMYTASQWVGDVRRACGNIALFSCHRIGRDADTGRALWADLETSDVILKKSMLCPKFYSASFMGLYSDAYRLRP